MEAAKEGERVKVYRIRNWNKHFEKSQTKKVSRACWVPLPNKHDGKSYRRLMRMKNGPALYGAWVLIVQVASKCPTRGVLLDEDGALSADDLAMKTDAPVELFEQALKVLSSKEVRWLESTDDPSTLPAQPQRNPSTLPDHSRALDNRTGQDRTSRTEQNNTRSTVESTESTDDDDHKDSIGMGRFETVRHTCRSISAVTQPSTPEDRDLIVKVAWLAAHGPGPDWLQDALQGVRIKKPRNPMAYLVTSLDNGAAKINQNFKQLLAQLEVAPEVTAEINRGPAATTKE